MEGELAGVRVAAERLVEMMKEDEELEIADYTMVQFGDSEVSDGISTMDPNEFLASLDELRAFGGGDLPEATNTGIMKAMELATDGASIYIFTNSEPNDRQLEAEVVMEAKRRNIKLSFAETPLAFFEGSGQLETLSAEERAELAAALPGPTPDYARIANATGGQAFFLPSFAMAKFADLVAMERRGDKSLLIERKGSISPLGGGRVPLLVDRTVTQLQITVSVTENGDAILRTPPPARRVLGVGSAGVTITSTNAGKIIQVANPEPGEWEVEVRGSGQYTVVGEVSSPLQFKGFQFVRPTQDLHGGFFPVLGEPVPAASNEPAARGEVTLEGTVSDAAFTLESEQGTVLARLSLSKDTLGARRETYHGVLPMIPTVPFRVVATGNLPTAGSGDRGLLYRRTSPMIYRGRSVGIETTGTEGVEAMPGQVLSLEYRIRNRGAAGDFVVTATTTRGSAVRLPAAVRIAQGASATVRVAVTVNDDIQPGEQEVLDLIVKQVGSAPTALTLNATSTQIEVVQANPGS
jgi:hypothetical protein